VKIQTAFAQNPRSTTAGRGMARQSARPPQYPATEDGKPGACCAVGSLKKGAYALTGHQDDEFLQAGIGIPQLLPLGPLPPENLQAPSTAHSASRYILVNLGFTYLFFFFFSIYLTPFF
jgi:hypothetical protein